MEHDQSKILIDIGCGPDPAPGHLGLDFRKTVNPDIVAKLPEFPLRSGGVDGFRARHVLEHFFSDAVIEILKEGARCLKIGGEFKVIVPHFSSPMSQHFDHKSFWSYNTPHTLAVDGLHDEHIGSHYELVKCQLHWMRKEYKGRFPWLVKFMNAIINRSPFTMERMAHWYGGIYEMEFILRKIK
ncbi:hypothetical protein ACFL4L_02085 [bacterium]